jgi:hypothetical protein
MTIRTEPAFTARVTLGSPIVIGHGPEGLRRFVPITGGTVDGPQLTGTVLGVGGDSQVVRADEVLAVEARYVIRTHDGVTIDVIARLAAGAVVAPQEYYFRTVAQFEAPLGSPYDWLNRSLFLGTAERRIDAAIVHFHRVL